MLIKEMHIAIDIGLQSINSNKRRLIQPEEKDRILNDCQLEYVKRIIDNSLNAEKSGFEEDQKRYSDISSLKRSASLNLYRDTVDKVFTVLPEDYYIYINSNTNHYYNCNIVNVSTTAINIYGGHVLFTTDNTTNSNKYNNFNIVIYDCNGNESFIFRLSNHYNKQFLNKDSKFEIINITLDIINNNDTYPINIYWEKYNNLYIPNNFIIIIKDGEYIIPKGCIKYNTIVCTYSNIEDDINNFDTINPIMIYDKYSYINNESSPIRLVKSEEVKKLNSTHFGKTIHTSPLCTISNNKLYIYHNNTFYPNSLDLEYIKKPRPMNINTGINCELNEVCQTEIVSLAIQKLQARVIAENYQLSVNENKNI